MQLGRWLSEWLLDDWSAARRRSLVKEFRRGDVQVLRRQWRLGQAAKVVLLSLALLVLASFVAPEAREPLRWALLLWAAAEALLIAGHVALGSRRGVSYGWAFHHNHPMLLHGLSARRDLRMKGLLALAATAIFLFAYLLI